MAQITLDQVAKKAGVSAKTVSRVLNDEPNVSERTARLVKKVIKELNYVPNLAARNLSRGKARAIGLVLGWPINTPYSSSLIDYSLVACDKFHHHLVLFSKTSDVSSKVLDAFLGKQIDGVILDKNAAEDDDLSRQLNSINIPCVVINSDQKENHPHASFVRIDDFAAAVNAVEYLIEMGHRAIGYIGNSTDTEQINMRLAGYYQALNDANIPVNEDWVYLELGSTSGFRIGVTGARQLLSKKARITALFAITDDIAMGAISSIWAHGLNVPGDISVVGFDDVYYSSLMVPPLTTIHQPIDEMANQAVKLISDGEARPEDLVLPTHLVVRGTCKSVVERTRLDG